MARPKASATTTPASTKSHKRQLSGGTPSTVTPGTRSSKRLKESTENTPASATPKKSKYFAGTGSEDEDIDEFSSEDAEASGYEDEDISVTEPEEIEEDSEDDYDSEEDIKRRKKAGGKPPAEGRGTVTVGGKDLWREGVKAGLGPGKQVFIEKPKPRGDGGIKYVPDKIHPNTMLFLKDLKANNDREWLKCTSTVFLPCI